MIHSLVNDIRSGIKLEQELLTKKKTRCGIHEKAS